MHYQRIVPFFQLTTSASLIVALSVALTPHLEVYRPIDFDDCRRDGGSIIACCSWQEGTSSKTRQNAWLHISSADPHKATPVATSRHRRPGPRRKVHLSRGKRPKYRHIQPIRDNLIVHHVDAKVAPAVDQRRSVQLLRPLSAECSAPRNRADLRSQRCQS